MAVNQTNNIWHRPTLALIGRRGRNYGKEVVNSTDIWTGEIRSPSSSSTKEEWSLTSWLIQLSQTQYKESGLWLKWKKRAVIFRQKYENGPRQFAKILQLQASWQILKLDEKQNYQKVAEWDEWPRWDIPVHWKSSPMMKNQQQRLKGKILIK